MSERLEQVIADEMEETAILRKNHHPWADDRARVLERIAAAAEPLMRWLSEAEAHTRSGMSPNTLRKRFGALEREGLAKMEGKVRYYLMAAIPQRRHLGLARDAGRKAGSRAA